MSDRAVYRFGISILLLVLGVQQVVTGGSVAAAGVVLELTGIAVALWGLDDLSAELFPSRPLPHRSVPRWIKRRIGLKPPPKVVQLGGAVETDMLASARLQTTKARPSEAASLAAWNDYWESRLGNLAEQIQWARHDMKKADNDLAKRISDEASARSAAVAELQARVRTVVGGEGGRGLVKTCWGLALAFVGVLMQGFG
jgi:hypothetical protein